MERSRYPLYHTIEEEEPSPSPKFPSTNCPDCLGEIIKLSIIPSVYTEYSEEDKINMRDKMFECLKKYGDIYKDLDIELYVDKNNRVTFLDEKGIISHLKTYVKSCVDGRIEVDNNKMMLYSILLNNVFRDAYNKYYYEIVGHESITPTKFGIDYLDNVSSSRLRERGGKTFRSKNKLMKRNSIKYKRKSIKCKRKSRVNKK
jgi:hypothetical protein